MPREPGPSDPEWRDTESSLRSSRQVVEEIKEQLKQDVSNGAAAAATGKIAEAKAREVFAEYLDKPEVDPGTGERVEVLKWFRFGHMLEGRPREIARHFGLLAAMTVLMCPAGEQRGIALQRLLESRDAALRAVLA